MPTGSVDGTWSEESHFNEAEAAVDRTLGALDGIAAECEPNVTEANESAQNRYTRRELIGQGGLAEVWHASDDHLGREVALKQPRAERPEAAETLTVEVDILCRLRHPNIVPLYDVITQPGDTRIVFYTMPLLKGQTFREAAVSFHAARPRGRNIRLGLSKMLAPFQSVCQAVAHAHDWGILHLDLKGDNVKLGDLGEAVVLDWGLARGVGTRVDRIAGTPAYLAPEQADIGRLTDQRTDVYGLGAILYEVLTGVPPFAGKDTVGVLKQVQTIPPTPPRAIWPELPRPIEAICMKALSKRPDDRYPSAEGLRADLERWLADETVVAYPESIRERVTRWTRNHGRAVVRVAVAVALVIAALTFGLVRVEREREVSAEQRQVALNALAAERESLALAIRAGNDCFGFTDDRLADLDGADPVRARLLERYLSYYQELLSRYQDDPDIQLEVAAARVRIGWIQIRIGRSSDSLATVETVIPLLEDLCQRQNPPERVLRLRIEANALVARNLAVLGRRDEGLVRMAQTEALGADFALLATGSERDRLLANVAASRGAIDPNPQAAEVALRTAAELFGQAAEGQGDVTQDLPNRVTSLVGVAIRQRDQGRRDEALDTLGEAQRLCDHLGVPAGWPFPLRRRMAACVNMEGVLHSDCGRFTVAAKVLVRAVELRRDLVRRNPSHLSLRMELATSLTNLGKALRLAGQPGEALAPAQEATVIGEEILRESPGSAHFRSLNGEFRVRAGWAEWASGRWVDAAAQFRRAGEVLTPLVQVPAADPPHLRFAAEAAFGLGLALARQGQWRDAWVSWQVGADCLRRLSVTSRPSGPVRPGNG